MEKGRAASRNAKEVCSIHVEGVDEDFADLLVEKEILPYLLLESLEIWWYY